MHLRSGGANFHFFCAAFTGTHPHCPRKLLVRKQLLTFDPTQPDSHPDFSDGNEGNLFIKPAGCVAAGSTLWRYCFLKLCVQYVQVAVLLASLCFLGCKGNAVDVSVSGVAPDFTLADLAGEQVRISDFRGTVVLLNFWATWCPPCREEIPSLIRLQKLMAGNRFSLVTVAVDDGGAAAVEKYFSRTGFRLPTLIDVTGEISRRYGITGIPETFVIDKQGMVVKKIIGPLDWSDPDMVAYLKQLADT